MENKYSLDSELETIKNLDLSAHNKELILDVLARLEPHDVWFQHSAGVANKAAEVAELLGLDSNFAYLNGSTHDWGKLDPVVLAEVAKTGKDFDIEKVKPHSKYAYDYLSERDELSLEQLDSLLTEKEDIIHDAEDIYNSIMARYLNRDVVVRHHAFQRERSYPAELPETPFSFEPGSDNWNYAAILAMVDFYDAYTSTIRPSNWRKANEAKGITAEEVIIENLDPCLESHIKRTFEAGVFKEPAPLAQA